jgi:hypothetical protein
MNSTSKENKLVAHAYNSYYFLRGKDQEDCGLKPAWTKKVCEIPSQPIKKLAVVVHACHSRYRGSSGINVRPYTEKYVKQKRIGV